MKKNNPSRKLAATSFSSLAAALAVSSTLLSAPEAQAVGVHKLGLTPNSLP